MVMSAGEEAVRRLQAGAEGTDPEPVLVFLGRRYRVVTDGTLAALLQYAAAGQPTARERARLESLGEAEPEPAGGEQAVLAAAHRLLEECLADFTVFSEAALAGKASADEVHDAVLRVVEVVTARPALAGMRLARYVVSEFAELDGVLLLAGRGIAALSAREACNAAFARLLSQVEPDQRAEWVEGLYLDYDPQSQALEMVRRMQADRAAGEGDGDGGDQVG